MALVVKDRVKETTTTTGTGTITLAGAVTGFQAFSTIGNGNTTYYTISSNGGAEWEVGIGTYTLVGTTLARTTVLASSNAGALVNFSAGTKDVYCVYPAGKMVSTDLGSATNVSGTVAIANGGTGATTAAAALTALGALPTAGGTVTGALDVSGNYINGGGIMGYVRSYSVPTATNVAIVADGISSTTLVAGTAYAVYLTTTGTGTNTGAKYLVYQTGASTWVAKLVSRQSNTSNNPSLAISGTTMVISHAHASTYTIQALIQRFSTGNTTLTSAFYFGIDSVFTYDGTNNSTTLNTGSTLNISGQFVSTLATGTAPFSVTSTTRVANLNVATAGTADALTTGRTIGMTGDVTWTSASFNGSANVTGTSTLANSGVTAGTYMSPKVTVDAKGRVTSAATAVFTSSDYFVQFTQTTNGWDVTRYVFPIPSWYYIETNNLGNLSTSISYPTNFTSSPSGVVGGMVVGAYSNGMGFYPTGSGWSPGMSWDGTTQSNYYSQYYNWGMINPSPLTVYAPSAPTQGFTFIYLQYPAASGNSNAQDFFGSISMGFSSSVGSSFAVGSPPLSGSSRRAYAVLMIDGNVGTVTCPLTGSTVVYAYNSYANKTYVFCEVTDNTSVGTIVGGSTWLTWGSSANYWGHAWADYT